MQWQEFRSHIRHLSTKNIGRIECAFELGKKVHGDQKRKSGEPYFSHPIAVAHMLADMGADADTLIAALLHDTVEDTDLTLAEIDRMFGGSVAAIIDGVTKLSAKDVGTSPKLDEQTETLRKIFTLMQQDVRIMVIKLVDRLHNMQTIEFLSAARQQSLSKETLEVFVKIADKLCMQDLRDELEALCLAVLEPTVFKQLSELRDANEQKGNHIGDIIRKQLREHDPHLLSRSTIQFEYKTWEKLRAQLNAGSSVATGLSSITIAFVAEDIDGCYRILGALHQLWQREIMSFQDFINAPQINGYKGLHTTIILEGGVRVRCKIRTREMQEYARKGIALRCFDEQAKGLPEYLPWTQRITPLTADTEGSSTDFWENLQSDILGESIIIHGPDDSTVQLPHDATALDGVFFLTKESALRTESIKVNGMEVPFGTRLVNAASLNFVLGRKERVELDWLKQVKTGFATAMIRSALAKQSESEKLLLGKGLLQKTFTERKRGFIDEFSEAQFVPKLKTLGYASLHDVYVSIADGRLQPTDVFTALFDRPTLSTGKRSPTSIIRYEADMDSVSGMDRLNLVHRKYGSSLSDIRYRRTEDKGTVSLQVRMSPEELATFQQDLILAGAANVHVLQQSFATALLIGSIIVLWGLDPMMARIILTTTQITPSELTFIRFLTFFAASSVTYGLYMALSRVKAKPISPFKPSFIASGIALFLTAILSYISLRDIPATQYILFIIAGLVITTVLRKLFEGRPPLRLFFAAMAIAIGILIFTVMQGFTIMGVLAGIGGALGFSMYSQLSRRYLETDARIHARYPAFVFWLSVIAMVLTMMLWPLVQPLAGVAWITIAFAALFAFIFTFLPYALYFECMMRTDTEILDRLLPFVCLVTMIAEATLSAEPKAILAGLPVILLFLWLYKPALNGVEQK